MKKKNIKKPTNKANTCENHKNQNQAERKNKEIKKESHTKSPKANVLR